MTGFEDAERRGPRVPVLVKFLAPAVGLLVCTPSRGGIDMERAGPGAKADRVAGDVDDASWLDRANDAVFQTLERGVDRLDGLFARGDEASTGIRNSTFRVKLHTRVEERGGARVTLEPDATADLYLPHLSRSLRLVVRSTDVDELPGVDPTQEDASWLLGVARTLGSGGLRHVVLGGGLKLKPSPEPYASMVARRTFEADPWYVTPAQKVFWSGDEGFGELTSLAVERVTGPRTGILSTSAARWTEKTKGLEWEQSLLLAFFPRGYTRSRRDRQHLFGLKGSVFGHKSGSGVVDLYRVELGWRRPLRREWLYLDVVPGLDFKRDEGWDEVVWIRFGLEVFFDGSARTGRPAAPRSPWQEEMNGWRTAIGKEYGE